MRDKETVDSTHAEGLTKRVAMTILSIVRVEVRTMVDGACPLTEVIPFATANPSDAVEVPLCAVGIGTAELAVIRFVTVIVAAAPFPTNAVEVTGMGTGSNCVTI